MDFPCLEACTGVNPNAISLYSPGRTNPLVLNSNMSTSSTSKERMAGSNEGPLSISHLEADTPTKHRVEVEKPSSMFVNEVLSDHTLGFMSRLVFDSPRRDQAESSIQEKKARAMQAFTREEFESGVSSPFLSHRLDKNA